jgi:hypothetical protein
VWLNDRAPALQAKSPEFKTKSNQKKKKDFKLAGNQKKTSKQVRRGDPCLMYKMRTH